MHIGPQLCARAQSRKGTDRGTWPHGHAFCATLNTSEGLQHRAGGDGDVGEHAVGPDANALAQVHTPLKQTIHIDFDIALASQLAAHIEARRVPQPHALQHERMRAPLLVGALEFGQLHRGVDAGHLHRVCEHLGHHRLAIGHRQLDHVGEVVLLLRVVVAQAFQPGQ